MCTCGSAYKSNAAQAGEQCVCVCVCVCPHPNQEQVQVRVSAFILVQASCSVFLSHSLFLSFSP